MRALSAQSDSDEPEPTSDEVKLKKNNLHIDDRLLKLHKNAYSNLEVERDLISTLHRDEMERSQHVRIWKEVVVTPVRETQRKS
jgi:flagellar hook-length control protein FliK